MRKIVFAFIIIVSYSVMIQKVWSQEASYQPDSISKLIEEIKTLIREDVSKADSLMGRAMELALGSQVDSLIALAYETAGNINFHKAQYFVAINYYKQCLANPYTAGNRDFANNINAFLGQSYYFTDQKENAIEAFEKTRLYAETSGDSVMIYRSIINLGAMYSKVLNFEKSEDYLYRSLKFFEQKNDSINLVTCYQNLAILSFQQKNSEKAIDYFDKSIAILRNLKNTSELLTTLFNKVYSLIELGRFKDVYTPLIGIDSLNEKTGNEFFSAAINHVKGLLYFQEKDYRNAEKMFLKAADFFIETGDNDRLYPSYQQLARIYFFLGDEVNHEKYLTLYQNAVIGAYQKESAVKIAEYQTIYETELKNYQIKNLNILVSQKNRIILLWVVLALLFLISATVVAFLYLKLRVRERNLFMSNIELTRLMVQDENSMYVKDIKSGNTTEKGYFISLFMRIKEEMVKNKMYLDPELRVVDLAIKLNTNEKYISQAIAAGTDTNFNRFLNQYRVNEAKKLLMNREYDNLTYHQIASRVGFANHFTLIRNFKELTGLTPHNYRKMAHDPSLITES